MAKGNKIILNLVSYLKCIIRYQSQILNRDRALEIR